MRRAAGVAMVEAAAISPAAIRANKNPGIAAGAWSLLE